MGCAFLRHVWLVVSFLPGIVSLPAQAAVCTLDPGNSASPNIVTPNLDFLVGRDHHVRTDDDHAHGVHAPCGHAKVRIDGRIGTTGAMARGVEGHNFADVFRDAPMRPHPAGIELVLGAGSAISTSGARAYGIWLPGSDNLLRMEGARIETTGDGSRAIWIWGDDNAAAIAGSTIATGGEQTDFFYPHGIDIVGSGNHLQLTDSTITTKGAYSRPVYSRGRRLADGSVQGDQPNTLLVTGSTLVSTGIGAHGLYSRGHAIPVRVDGDRYGAVSPEGSSAIRVPVEDQPPERGTTRIDVTGSRITTRGDEAYGIHIRDDGVGSNAGRHDALVHGNWLAVSNSAIVTAGAEAHAVYTDDRIGPLVGDQPGIRVHGNRVTLAGSRIATSGDAAHGIATNEQQPGSPRVASDILHIEDSRVETAGMDAHGLYAGVAGGSAVIRNSLITARYGDAIHVAASGTRIRIDSSTVESQVGDAIRVNGELNTLALGADARVNGRIAVGSGNTLSLPTRQAVSALWSVDGTPKVVADGPFPVFGTVGSGLATYDPAGPASDLDALADRIGLIVPSLFDMGDGVTDLRLSPFYARSRHTHPLLPEARHGASGVRAGLAIDDPDLELFAGFLRQTVSVASGSRPSWDNEANGVFAGLSGTIPFDGVSLEGSLAAGMLERKTARWIHGNAMPAARTRAQYDSFWVARRMALTMPDADRFGVWSVSPRISLDYGSEWVDAGSERGPDGSAHMASRRISVLEVGLGLNAVRPIEGNGAVSLRVRVAQRRPVTGKEVQVTLLDDPGTISGLGRKRLAAKGGLQVAVPVSDSVVTVVGADVAVSRSGRSASVHLDIRF